MMKLIAESSYCSNMMVERETFVHGLRAKGILRDSSPGGKWGVRLKSFGH